MKIAIAGYGIEGKVNAKYWLDQGHDVTILDEKPLETAPSGVEVRSGSDVFSQLGEFDMVVRTASLPPHKLTTAKKIWSATNEFFARCPAPIIGVTGTKGKGTTSSLIAAILRAAGKTVHLVGNIGVPALEVVPQIQAADVVVFEMSSFQLWDIEKSPRVAVVLMIEPDHLDVHLSLEEYVTAKSQISAHQQPGDAVIYHPTNQFSQQVAFCGEGNKIRYGVPEDGGVYVKEGGFLVQERLICGLDALQLPGRHNIDNACAAVTAVLAYDPTTSNESVETGLKNFTGLPHRLKLIRDVRGVRYYDDSYSSAPGAAVAAMKAFTEPEIIILGGFDKKVDFHDFASFVASQKNLKKALLIGQTRHRLAEAFAVVGVSSQQIEMIDSTDFAAIVQRAHELAEPGDVVLLSPACASFDMFKNFTERGEQFIKLVEAL